MGMVLVPVGEWSSHGYYQTLSRYYGRISEVWEDPGRAVPPGICCCFRDSEWWREGDLDATALSRVLETTTGVSAARLFNMAPAAGEIRAPMYSLSVVDGVEETERTQSCVCGCQTSLAAELFCRLLLQLEVQSNLWEWF